MMGIKLNAQVIKNLQNMHEKSLPPTGASGTGARMRMELPGVSGLGPPATQGATHGRTQPPPASGGVADVIESGDGHWQ
jgi:hypothetical protein